MGALLFFCRVVRSDVFFERSDVVCARSDVVCARSDVFFLRSDCFPCFLTLLHVVRCVERTLKLFCARSDVFVLVRSDVVVFGAL